MRDGWVSQPVLTCFCLFCAYYYFTSSNFQASISDGNKHVPLLVLLDALLDLLQFSKYCMVKRELDKVDERSVGNVGSLLRLMTTRTSDRVQEEQAVRH